MKCQYCNGTGEHVNDANRMTTCEFCGGTGEIKVTKEEYIRSCSTEELADAIADVYLLGYTNGYNETDIAPKKKWVEWLKEKHEE